MSSIKIERLGFKKRKPIAFKAYAEDCSKQIADAEPGYVFLPGAVVGNLIVSPGSPDLIVASLPWGRTVIKGGAQVGQTTFVQAGNKAAIVESLTLTTLRSDLWDQVPVAGDIILVCYYSGAGLNNDTLTSGAFETFIENGATTKRRCYGELLTVASYDAATKTVTTVEPLTRLYQVANGSDDTSLKVFNVTSVALKDFTLKDVEIQLPAYGYVDQGFQQSIALKCTQVMGLTLDGVKTKGAAGSSVDIERCRNVLVQNCQVEMQPYHRVGSLLYGFNIHMAHHATIQDHMTIFARYGVSINRGSSNFVVQRLKARSLHWSGADADIHGGDCLKITFKDFFAEVGVRLGNPNFKRGADDILVSNVQSFESLHNWNSTTNQFEDGRGGIEVIGAVRNLKVIDCTMRHLQVNQVADDDGNGFNNSTGASHSYSQDVVVEASKFEVFKKAANQPSPLLFTFAGSSPIRFVNWTIESSQWIKHVEGAGIICIDRPCVSGTTNTIDMSDCTIRWGGTISADSSIDVYASGSTSMNNPALTFSDCQFENIQGDWLKAVRWWRGATFDLNNCTYKRGSSSPMSLDKALFLGPPTLFAVEPSGGAGLLTANGETVYEEP